MKYLRWALLVGVFLIPFIPFIVTSSLFFPFITGKNFAFRILIELLFGGLVVLALRDPAYRPKFSWVSIGVLALLVSATLATFTSVDPTKSFWSNFERMEGLVGVLHLAGWFFVASVMLNAEKLWERFMQVSIGASVIMAIYGLFQIGGLIVINQGGLRLDATLGNAIYLAVYMLFHIFFTLFLMLRHKGPKFVYAIYSVALFLQILVLYYTATRSATLGLIGGLLVSGLAVAWFERGRPVVRRVAIAGVALVVLIVITFFAFRNTEAVRKNQVLVRFATISFQETTVKSRFMIWDMALSGVAERPITGWGQENFNYVFNKYYNPKMYAQEQWFDRAHNAFIDWLVAAGLLGLLSFVSLFVFAAWAVFRADTLSPGERAVFLGLIAAYAFHSFFVFDNLISSIYFFVLLAFVHSLSQRKVPGSVLMTRPVEGGALATGASVVAVATLLCVYFLNVPGLANARELIVALTPTKMGLNAQGVRAPVQKDPRENIESFDHVTTAHPLGRQEAVEQLLQTAVSAVASQNVDPAIKEEFAKLAYDRGGEFLKQRKDDARMELFYGSFLNQVGRRDEALQHLTKAHQLSPNKQWILFELGLNSYASAGNIEQAIAVVKKAYDLAPEFDEARIFYAMTLYLGGKTSEADQLLMDRFGTVLVDDSRILRAYGLAKLNDRVVSIWEERLKQNPSNVEIGVSLALAYKEAGQTAKGLALLREIAAKVPEYRTQIDELAKQQFGAGL